MTGVVKSVFEGPAAKGKGRALYAEVLFPDGGIRTCLVAQWPGMQARPCRGDRAEVEKSGSGFRVTAAPGGEESALEEGEAEACSRSAKGEKRARHVLKRDGRQFIGNREADLFKALILIIDRMKDLQTFGSPGAHSVNEAYKAVLEGDKKTIEAFLTGEA